MSSRNCGPGAFAVALAAMTVLTLSCLRPIAAYHLGDIDSKHCWEIPSNNEVDCPPGVDIAWDPPPELEVDLGVNVTFQATFTDAFAGDFNVTRFSHMNYHFCKSDVGVCTPFVTAGCAAPGAFTSTPEIKGGPGSYTQLVSLPTAGNWQGIMHVKVGPYSIATARYFTVVQRVVKTCPVGFRLDDGTGDCSPCPEGTQQNTAGFCKPCDRGFFSPAASTLDAPARCLPCDDLGAAFYADSPGSERCERCPDNSVRYAGTRGRSVDECVCREGFWDPLGRANGTGCVPCQAPGGECPGGIRAGTNVLPHNADGWWGQSHRPGKFLECGQSGICKEGFECDEKREGRLCATCAAGYTQVGRSCWACSDDRATNVSLTILVLLFVLFLWFAVDTVVGSYYESFEVILLYAQVTEIVGTFTLSWEDTLHAVVGFMSFVNFDTSFVAPSCAWGGWSYTWAFGTQMALCLVFVGWQVGRYALSYLHLRLVVGRRGAAAAARGFGARRMGLACTPAQLNDVADAGIKFSLSMAVLMYNSLCIKSFESFVCHDLPDGSGQFLVAYPDIDCGSPTHLAHMIISGAGLLLFVVGIPGAVAWVLWTGRKHHKLTEARFLARFGFLYSRYEIEFFWWELIFLARRLLLCAISVFMYRDGMAQAVVGLVALVVCFGAQFYARPFRRTRLDYIDSTGLFCNIMQVLAGILFTASEFHHNGEIEAIVLLALASTLLTGLWALGDELNSHRASVLARAQLERRVPAAMIENPGLVSQGYSKLFADVKAAFGVLDSNKDGSLQHDEVLDIVRAVLPGPVADSDVAALMRRADADGDGSLDLVEFQKLLFAELTRLARPAGRFGPMSALKARALRTAAAGAGGAVGARRRSSGGLDVSLSERDFREGADLATTAARRLSESPSVSRRGAAEHKVAPEPLEAEDATRAKRAAALRTVRNSTRALVAGGDVGVGGPGVSAPGDGAKADGAGEPIGAAVGELSATIRPRWLKTWLDAETDSSHLAMFHAVDAALSPYLADASVNSAFSFNPESRLFQSLIDSSPRLLDWLLVEDMDVVQMFGRSMQRLIHFMVTQEEAGVDCTSEMIEDMDRAPLAIWLCGVDARRNVYRSALRSLLAQMHHARTHPGTAADTPAARAAALAHKVSTSTKSLGSKIGAGAPAAAYGRAELPLGLESAADPIDEVLAELVKCQQLGGGGGGQGAGSLPQMPAGSLPQMPALAPRPAPGESVPSSIGAAPGESVPSSIGDVGSPPSSIGDVPPPPSSIDDAIDLVGSLAEGRRAPRAGGGSAGAAARWSKAVPVNSTHVLNIVKTVFQAQVDELLRAQEAQMASLCGALERTTTLQEVPEAGAGSTPESGAGSAPEAGAKP